MGVSYFSKCRNFFFFIFNITKNITIYITGQYFKNQSSLELHISFFANQLLIFRNLIFKNGFDSLVDVFSTS